MPTAKVPDDWLARAMGVPPDERAGADDGGAPPYPSPSAFPNPSLEATQVGADGYGGEVATAPPVPRRSIGRSLARGLREVAETIILALLIFLAVRAVVQNFQVEGSSMEPTLRSSWYLLVNKAIYWEINLKTIHKFLPFIEPGDDPTRYIFRGPRRGDVIVFEAPDQAPGQHERDFIKRVIAVPGEVVALREGTVFIDGKPLDEPYVANKSTDSYGPVRIPEGCYFVLGDNRTNSSDSRRFGAVPKENIIGQAWLKYWPFSAFGLVDNTSVEPSGGALPEPRKQPDPVEVALAAAPLAECYR